MKQDKKGTMQTRCRHDVDQHCDVDDVNDIHKKKRHSLQTQCRLDLDPLCNIDNIDDVNRISEVHVYDADRMTT